MNEAPPGFIPLNGDVIVNVNHISSVKQERVKVVDPVWQDQYYSAFTEYIEAKASNPDLRFDRTPWNNPQYLADTFLVSVEAGGVRGTKDCSLVQFMAKMLVAMEESK